MARMLLGASRIMRVFRSSIVTLLLLLPTPAALTTVGCSSERSDQRASTNTDQVDAGDGDVHQVDASDPVDAGSTVAEGDRWCAKQGAHTLCADFDGPEPLAVWPDADLDGEGLKTTPSERSSPNALLVTQPAASGGSPGPEITISQRIQVTSPKIVRAEFDLHLGAKAQNDPSVRTPVVISIGNNDVVLNRRPSLLWEGPERA